MSTHKLDIVIPCYNPLQGWEDVIISNFQSLEQGLGFVPRFIIVNDGSSKNVGDKQLAKLKASISDVILLTQSENKGKGAALRVGVAEATAPVILFTDVDFPYEQESLIQVYKTVKAGNNIVLGTRDEGYYANVPRFRRWLSKSFRFLMKMFLRLKSSDTQCGLKGFDQNGKKLFLDTSINRFLFDLEFVLYASRSNSISLKTVPVTLKQGIVFSELPAWVLLHETVNFLKLFLRITFR